MITLLENLQAFIRINNIQDMVISCMYKRVNDYDTIDSKLRVITQLYNTKPALKKDKIIEQVQLIFNISEEDAIDEYEQWEHLSEGGKIFRKGENGIECTINLLGEKALLEIASITSY